MEALVDFGNVVPVVVVTVLACFVLVAVYLAVASSGRF